MNELASAAERNVAGFKAGDVVRLHSGGIQMTVLGTVEDQVQCRWSDGTGFDTGTFPKAALVEDKPGDEYALTDREMMVGLFNLVGALAERLTGQEVGVRIVNQAGHRFDFAPTTRYITWLPKVAG